MRTKLEILQGKDLTGNILYEDHSMTIPLTYDGGITPIFESMDEYSKQMLLSDGMNKLNEISSKFASTITDEELKNKFIEHSNNFMKNQSLNKEE